MGFLSKLFGRHASEVHAPAAVGACPHVTLVPRWTAVAEMGDESKVSGYTCQGCGQAFTPAEGRELKQYEAERVQAEFQPPD